MRTRIEIDTRTFVRFWLVVLGFLAVILALWIARGALITIGIALFLALALNPPVSMIARRLPGKSRVGATFISYLAVLVLLGGFLVAVVPPVIEQTTKFAQTVPGFIDDVSHNRGAFDNFINKYGLKDQVDTAVNNAKNQASDVAKNLGNVLINGANAVLGGVISIIFVLVLTFLMLIEGPKWMERIWGLYEDQHKLERHRTLVQRMYHVVVGFVNGQITVAAIAAAAALVVNFILSVIFHMSANLALPLAFIIFLCELMPLIGATIAAILVTLVLLFNNVTAAIVFLIYYLLYQQVENNFINPTIQARSVELSALSILVAILIGVSLFGLLGAIIAIPIAGCLRVLLMDYLAYAKKKRKESKNPAAKLVDKIKEAV